ncbi:hypothetical protein ANTQUA_LOCUS8681 [Anthophora quadrimaculata]
MSKINGLFSLVRLSKFLFLFFLSLFFFSVFFLKKRNQKKIKFSNIFSIIKYSSRNIFFFFFNNSHDPNFFSHRIEMFLSKLFDPRISA